MLKMKLERWNPGGRVEQSRWMMKPGVSHAGRSQRGILRLSMYFGRGSHERKPGIWFSEEDTGGIVLRV